jgi:hypothetical protein
VNEPRNDRWIQLSDLGRRLAGTDEKLKNSSRRTRRQYAYRALRAAEEFHGEKFHKRWRGRIYVNANALDRIRLPEERVLSDLEKNVADLSSKTRHLHRQVNDHGSRLRNLESWRRLTAQYLSDVATLEGNESDSKETSNSGRVRACAR